jgi:hypothetical protein
MLINPIAFQPNLNIYNKIAKSGQNNTRSQLRLINSYPCDTVSFGNNSDQGGKFFQEFNEQLRNSKQTLDEAIRRSFSEENLLGEGQNSKVYNIDKIDDFVIKVDKRVGSIDQLDLTKITPKKDDFEGVNMGQPIGKIANGVYILLRQNGDEHSIKNWTFYVNHPNEITLQHSQKFLQDVEKVSNMPEKAYLEFANSIKRLSKEHCKVDSINPNNLLIDKSSINPIDYFERDNDNYKNSYFDMICSLLDFRLFDKYHELLDNEQQEKLINASKQVIKKCKEAAQKTNLTTDEQIYLRFLNATNMSCGGDHIGMYERFKNSLKNLANLDVTVNNN